MISRPVEGTFIRDGQQPTDGRNSNSIESIRTAGTNFSMDSVALAKQIAAFEPLPEIPRSSQHEWETLAKLFKATPDPLSEEQGQSSSAESIQSRARQVATRLSSAFRVSLARLSSASGMPSGMNTPRKSNAETIQVMLTNEPPLPTYRPTLQSKYSTNRQLFLAMDNQTMDQTPFSPELPRYQARVEAPRTGEMVTTSIDLLEAMAAPSISQAQSQPESSASPFNGKAAMPVSGGSPKVDKGKSRETKPTTLPRASARAPDFAKSNTSKTKAVIPPRPPRPESSKSPFYNDPVASQSPPVTGISRTFSPPLASPTPAIARSVTQPTRVALSSRPQLISVHRSQPSVSTNDEPIRSARPSISQSNTINFSRPTFATLGNSTMASRQTSTTQVGSIQSHSQSASQPRPQATQSPPQSELRILPYESRVDFTFPAPSAVVPPPPPAVAVAPAPGSSAQRIRPSPRSRSRSRSTSSRYIPRRPSTTLYSIRSSSSFDFGPESNPVELFPAPLEVRKHSSMSPTTDTEMVLGSGYSSMYIDDKYNGMNARLSLSSRYSSTASSLIADAGWDRPAVLARMDSELRELREARGSTFYQTQATSASMRSEVDLERQEATEGAERARAREREISSPLLLSNQDQDQEQEQRTSMWPGPSAPRQNRSTDTNTKNNQNEGGAF